MSYNPTYLTGCVYLPAVLPTLDPLEPLLSRASPTPCHCLPGLCSSLNKPGMLPLHSLFPGYPHVWFPHCVEVFAHYECLSGLPWPLFKTKQQQPFYFRIVSGLQKCCKEYRVPTSLGPISLILFYSLYMHHPITCYLLYFLTNACIHVLKEMSVDQHLSKYNKSIFGNFPSLGVNFGEGGQQYYSQMGSTTLTLAVLRNKSKISLQTSNK